MFTTLAVIFIDMDCQCGREAVIFAINSHRTSSLSEKYKMLKFYIKRYK